MLTEEARESKQTQERSQEGAVQSSTYCVLGSVLGPRDTAVYKRDQNPYLLGADILGKGDSEEISK